MEKSSASETFESDGVSLLEIFDKYIPYWPWFILLEVIFLSSAWLYLRYKSPVYETTASILIKDQNNGVNSIDPLQAFNLFNTNKSVDNEIEILKSRSLMQEVVENLNLYAPIMVTGRIRTSSAYVFSPVRIEAREPDSLKFVNEIPFNFDKGRGLVVIDESKFPLNSWQNTKYGILKFSLNPKYKRPENDDDKEHYSFSLQSIRSSAISLLSSLTVLQSGTMSTVIDISFKGEVPERNEDIVNELLKVYNKAAILDKNILAANTLKFVDNRLKFVEHDLDSIEASLQHFRSGNKLTDISAQGQIYLQTVAENDKQISDINMQLAVLDQVSSYLSSKGSMGGLVPSTLGVSDPVLTQLLQKLSDLELQYEQMKKIVPEKNPAVVAIVDGINKLKPAIRENILNQRRNLNAAKQDLSKRSERYASILTTIPQKERELLSINRQQTIKNNIYTFLLQKKEETALSFASTIADSRVIDKAETEAVPVSPKKNIIYILAFVLAIIIGVIYIYLKSAFTRTVQSPKDISRNTSVPVLGELVFDTANSPIVIEEGKRSFIAEQFRQLRTSLVYMGIGDSNKKILITSSVSGEGKSFISINLGISLSLTNSKVVLIELDLRKPKLSKQLGISSREGLSNYLIGKLPYDQLVRETGFENLSIIPSGSIPPNPSELITNGKLNELFSKLESEFDYLVLDAPPINPVTDALILSPKSDVTLFVVRHKYTPKVFVNNLEQKKEAGVIKNPAIILNGIKIKRSGIYGSQKYGNGYGYSEDAGVVKNWWQRIF